MAFLESMMWEEFIYEFEADGVETDPEEDEEFSIDDDSGESTEGGENQTEPDTEDPTEEDEEYNMDDEGEESTEDQPEQDNTEENQEEESEEDEEYEIPDEEGETSEEGNEDEEFSMDDDSGESTEGNDTEGGDNNTEDSSSDSTETTDETEPKLRDLESVVFDGLSDEEKKIKIKELKELFITIYKKCDSISQMISDIKRDEETIQIVEYISNTLIELKQYVNDYINDVFDSRTYVENLAQLQKYITILNAINKVFVQIRQENNQ